MFAGAPCPSRMHLRCRPQTSVPRSHPYLPSLRSPRVPLTNVLARQYFHFRQPQRLSQEYLANTRRPPESAAIEKRPAGEAQATLRGLTDFVVLPQNLLSVTGIASAKASRPPIMFGRRVVSVPFLMRGRGPRHAILARLVRLPGKKRFFRPLLSIGPVSENFSRWCD